LRAVKKQMKDVEFLIVQRENCRADFECGDHVVLGLSGRAAFTLLLVYVSNRSIDKSIYALPIWQLHHKSTYASLCARIGPTGYEPVRIVFLVIRNRDSRRRRVLMSSGV